MPTIPLEDTALISEQDDPYNLVDLTNLDDPVPFHSTDTISIGLRTASIPATGDEPYYEAGDMSISYGLLLNAFGRQIGQTHVWFENLPIVGPQTYRGVALPPNKIFFEGSMFLANSDELSSVFNERDLNLSRFTMDTDSELLELTGSADAPLLPGKAIVRYKTIRNFRIEKEQSLPNSRLGSPDEYLRAVCNSGLSTNLVLTIKKYYNGGSVTAGTIVFDEATVSPGDTWINGVFTFNDPDVYVKRNYMFVVEATDVPVDFEWVSINMLGTCIKYVDPSYNAPE